jgi:hypothetical protein
MLMRFGIGPADWVTNLWRDWAAGRLRRAWLAASPGVNGRELAAWRPVVALAWLRARDAGRTSAFMGYMDKALQRVGLPTLS